MRAVIISIALAVLVGCASAKVDTVAPTGASPSASAVVEGPPNRILVQRFTFDPEVVRIEAAPGAMAVRAVRGRDDREERYKVGDEVAVAFAKTLVKELREREVRAAMVLEGDAFTSGSIVLEGEFLSINQGNRLARITVGFGAGATAVTTAARIVRAGDSGNTLLRELKISARGSRRPSIASAPRGGVGRDAQRSASAIADAIEDIYIEKGWKAPQ
jgi:hypothetical protein